LCVLSELLYGNLRLMMISIFQMTSKKSSYQIMKPNLRLRSHLMLKKIPMLRMIGKNFQMKENNENDLVCTASSATITTAF